MVRPTCSTLYFDSSLMKGWFLSNLLICWIRYWMCTWIDWSNFAGSVGSRCSENQSQAYGWHVASKPSYMQSGSGINKLCRGDESIANYICLIIELEVQPMLLELGGKLTSAGTEENLHQCIHGMKHPHGFWFSPSYNWLSLFWFWRLGNCWWASFYSQFPTCGNGVPDDSD